MSIRLKKVEWSPVKDGSGSNARIMGVGYASILSTSSGKWFAVHKFSVISSHADEDSAKSACEQHALERIREAVEVVPDHIPGATKMIEPNSPEIPDGWRDISTAPRDGGDILLFSPSSGIQFGWWGVDDGFSGDTEPQWLSSERDYNSAGYFSQPLNPTHWMPIPKPPKEGIA